MIPISWSQFLLCIAFIIVSFMRLKTIRIPAILMLAFLLPWQADISASDARSLSLYHTHTDKRISATYYVAGAYDEAALHDLNEFLADFRTGDVTEIDPGVFDILFEIQKRLDSSGEYQVISAYRSPETNEMLRNRSGGVARNSQHLLGKAIDVRLTGVDTAELRDTALALKRGGVGYYRDLDFVHVDTGRVRRW